MKVYIISDTHFNHLEKMIEYCGRPNDYEERLKNSLLSLHPGSILIHLGDITIGGDRHVHSEIIEKIQCQTKILVIGNHDRKGTGWYLNHGWSLACESFRWDYYGHKILFSHAPMPYDNFFTLNIHGHFHNSPESRHGYTDGCKKEICKLFAPEYWDYRAVDLRKFIESI